MLPILAGKSKSSASTAFVNFPYLAPMPKSVHIPYRSLWKMAFLTAPLLAVALASPILIASGLGWEYAGLILPATTGIALLAWSLNLALLPWMQRLGKWKWLQIFLIGGLMICVSFLVIRIMHGQLPPQAERLSMVRYVNAFAVNTIIYVLIDLRMLSETKARLVEENAQLRMSGLETQYQILKDQVNPHFLFNALGTIRSLARRDPELTEAYIIRLSDFLRVTLQEARDHVPLADELRLVRDYVELQKMRFHEALVFECSAEVPEGDLRLPHFALLTLVENAVKHNAMTVESPLHIRISRVGRRITVWNNRQSRPLHSPGNGSGIANLRKRCQILGHGELVVEETADAFSVSFDLSPS